MNEAVHFINLTNGYTHWKKCTPENVLLLRIQSTACEQKRWSNVVMSATPDFLLSLAIGRDIVVHDSSERDREPRALWQGLPFILFSAQRAWGLVSHTDRIPCYIAPRGNIHHEFDSAPYFDSEYRKLSAEALTHLRYFKKFVEPYVYGLVWVCRGGGHPTRIV